MVQLGDISMLNGDVLKAVKLWLTAKPLFERSSQRKQLAELDLKLASLSNNQQATLNCLCKIPTTTEHVPQLLEQSLNSTGTGEKGNMDSEEKELLST
jgi:hypothetical protein